MKISSKTFYKILNVHNFNIGFFYREEIVDHRVCWNSHFEFECKLTATLSTGTLDACTCRVSVRRVRNKNKNEKYIFFLNRKEVF